MTVPARACLGCLRPSFGDLPGAPPPSLRPAPPGAPPSLSLPAPHHLAPLLHPAGSLPLCCRHRLRPPARPRPVTRTSALPPTAPAERGRGGSESDRAGPAGALSSTPHLPRPLLPRRACTAAWIWPAARRGAALRRGPAPRPERAPDLACCPTRRRAAAKASRICRGPPWGRGRPGKRPRRGRVPERPR